MYLKRKMKHIFPSFLTSGGKATTQAKQQHQHHSATSTREQQDSTFSGKNVKSTSSNLNNNNTSRRWHYATKATSTLLLLLLQCIIVQGIIIYLSIYESPLYCLSYNNSNSNINSPNTTTAATTTLPSCNSIDKVFCSGSGKTTTTADDKNTIMATTTTTASSTTRSNETRNKTQPPPRPYTLHLLGERHSGTNWITRHLEDCFGHKLKIRKSLSRWKHWFQNDRQYATRRAVVVVMTRHPLDWVESMRTNPYHAPSHFHLDWHKFVTKPWTLSMEIEDYDREQWIDIDDNNKTNITASTTSMPDATSSRLCYNNFKPNEVVPCGYWWLRLDNGRDVSPVYELQRDGSGVPYDSIVDLRRDKLVNFMNVSQFDGVQHHRLFRYEDMVTHGTQSLVEWLETELGGIKSKCKATEPQRQKSLLLSSKNNPNRTQRRVLSPEYLDWMRHHVDWEIEALAGYRMPNGSSGDNEATAAI